MLKKLAVLKVISHDVTNFHYKLTLQYMKHLISASTDYELFFSMTVSYCLAGFVRHHQLDGFFLNIPA